ncbi:MAG: Slp family lipoprotein [Pseudomonadota bacterium]
MNRPSLSAQRRGLTRSLLTASLLVLSACSTVPEPLRGTYPLIEPQDTARADIGRDVRWGGVILDTKPDQSQTCFEVLSRELDGSMRPRNQDLTQGRFIACRDGFLDPEVFAKGREITLLGSVTALDQRKVGDFDYQYPVLATSFITMWPERPDVIINNFNDPFFWGPYWGPYWGRYPYYGWGRIGYPGPRTTVRTGGSTDRVDVYEGAGPNEGR